MDAIVLAKQQLKKQERFQKKPLDLVVSAIGLLPKESFFVAMGEDGLPALANLDDIRCGVLFWGNYHLPVIPKANSMLKFDQGGYRVNYTAISIQDCVRMTDEILSHMEYLGGNMRKNVVLFEDFSVLTKAVSGNLRQIELLEKCLTQRNVFVIGNAISMTDVLYSHEKDCVEKTEWGKYFQIMRPTADPETFSLDVQGKDIRFYAPLY